MKKLRLSAIKRIFTGVIITGVLALFVIYYINGEFVHFDPRVRLFSSQISAKDTFIKPQILVLYWGFPWREKAYVPAEGTLYDGVCGVTHDRNRIKEAQVVIFHFTTIHSDDMPWLWYRNPNQTFVWWSAENPAVLLVQHKTIRWSAFDGFFNWTWTYRRDSDLHTFYGYRGDVIRSVTKGKRVVDDIIKSKQKNQNLAVWMVSKCNYTHGARLRMNYAKQLRQAGIDFDGFGECFSNPNQVSRSNPELMRETIRKYKFYFAFENGLHCKDYITEKFWDNALGNGVVPIVWGPTKNDILEVAPLDSFIFAEDYETPKELAKYLKYLNSNDDEYRKYFRWREDESMSDKKMINMTRERFPELNVEEETIGFCEKLRKNNGKKTVKSLVSEFIQNNPKECTG